MNKKQKSDLKRIIIAAILFVPLFLLEHVGTLVTFAHPVFTLLLCLVPYLIVGHDVWFLSVFGTGKYKTRPKVIL